MLRTDGKSLSPGRTRRYSAPAPRHAAAAGQAVTRAAAPGSPGGSCGPRAGQGPVLRLDKTRMSPKLTSSPRYGLGEEAPTARAPQDGHGATSRGPWSQAHREGCPWQPCACQYRGTRIPRETLTLIPKVPTHFNGAIKVKTVWQRGSCEQGSSPHQRCISVSDSPQEGKNHQHKRAGASQGFQTSDLNEGLGHTHFPERLC